MTSTCQTQWPPSTATSPDRTTDYTLFSRAFSAPTGHALRPPHIPVGVSLRIPLPLITSSRPEIPSLCPDLCPALQVFPSGCAGGTLPFTWHIPDSLPPSHLEGPGIGPRSLVRNPASILQPTLTKSCQGLLDSTSPINPRLGLPPHSCQHLPTLLQVLCPLSHPA